MSLRRWLFVALFFMGVTQVFAQEASGAAKFFSFWNLPKVWVAAGLALIGTVLLITRRVDNPVRLLLMAIAFFAFGVLSLLPLGEFARGMGLHPSPMCIVEKPFVFLKGGRAIPMIFISLFAVIALLTVVSNKSFCGWTCPIGALQELFYNIPLLKKFKTKLPFGISNAVRVGLFALFLVLLFTISFSIFGWINAFHILHWHWELELIIPLLIVVLGGLFIYRPFCYLICPLGLLTWLLEQVSVTRVKLNRAACTDCKICVKKSPCPTVPSILEGKKIRPDCHACGKCIEVCPERALDFKI